MAEMNGKKRNCISIPDTANTRKALDDGSDQTLLMLTGCFIKRNINNIGVKRAIPKIETVPPCQLVNPVIPNSTFERTKKGNRTMIKAIKITGLVILKRI